jgi:hypothetical protein
VYCRRVVLCVLAGALLSLFGMDVNAR